MSIVASNILEDRAQADGRRAIHERHTDNLGIAYDVFYLAEVADDLDAAKKERSELGELFR